MKEKEVTLREDFLVAHLLFFVFVKMGQEINATRFSRSEPRNWPYNLDCVLTHPASSRVSFSLFSFTLLGHTTVSS